jgi:hypothetical protein
VSEETSERDIINLVNRQKATVVYFSVAAGFVYIWLIVPTKGIVKFHQVTSLNKQILLRDNYTFSCCHFEKAKNARAFAPFQSLNRILLNFLLLKFRIFL